MPNELLALYSSGWVSGLIIDVGHIGSSVTPIIDGSIIYYGREDTLTGG